MICITCITCITCISYITGITGITGITDNLKNGKSLTDLLTTSNQEMLTHLKRSSVVKQPDEFVDLLQGRGFKLLDRDIVDDETLG